MAESLTVNEVIARVIRAKVKGNYVSKEGSLHYVSGGWLGLWEVGGADMLARLEARGYKFERQVLANRNVVRYLGHRDQGTRAPVNAERCGWAGCRSKKVVAVMVDEVAGPRIGVCSKHQVVVGARVGWVTERWLLDDKGAAT